MRKLLSSVKENGLIYIFYHLAENEHDYINYPKEQYFRRLEMREYFDDWGNRCYLFSAETPGYFTVEKGGFYYADFSMNTEAFAALGGKYVFSAAYIDQPERTGLKLFREEPFETPESYYKIYIYTLNDN